MLNRFSTLLVASLAMAASGGAGFAHGAPAPQAIVSKKIKKGLLNGAALPSGEPLVGRRSNGMTCARQKRQAIKRRNQLRNKRIGRG